MDNHCALIVIVTALVMHNVYAVVSTLLCLRSDLQKTTEKQRKHYQSRQKHAK